MLTLTGEGMDSRESPLEQITLQWKVPCQMWKYIHNIYYDFNSFFATPGLLKPLMQVGGVMAFTQHKTGTTLHIIHTPFAAQVNNPLKVNLRTLQLAITKQFKLFICISQIINFPCLWNLIVMFQLPVTPTSNIESNKIVNQDLNVNSLLLG